MLAHAFAAWAAFYRRFEALASLWFVPLGPKSWSGLGLQIILCGNLPSHIRDMNVGAEPDVVGEIPADVVGVVVDDDVVAIPEPVATIADVEGRDAEVVSAEPEAVGTTASKAPHEAGAESALKMAVFPGMVEVEAGVAASPIVADPFAILVDVRGLRVAFVVAKGSMIVRLLRLSLGYGPADVVVGSRWSASRDVASPYCLPVPGFMAASAMVLVLCKGWKRRDQHDGNQ